MEDRETPRMQQYGASETTRVMMATVCHVTSSSGLRKFQTDGFLFVGVYKCRKTFRETERFFINLKKFKAFLHFAKSFKNVFRQNN